MTAKRSMSSRPVGGGTSSDAGAALLAVDVHNAHTHLGVFEHDALIHDWWIDTHADTTPDALAADLSGVLGLRGLGFAHFAGSIVSSTVPNLRRTWPQLASEYLGHSMLVVGPGLKTGMAIRITQPAELGANRLVNAVAAYERVGAACIVVDFSTAIAFDVVSTGGEYLGSVLAPGVDVSFENLAARAAALPSVTVEQPASPIGRTTVEAMQAGVVYGAAGLCDGLIGRIKLELEGEPAVLATGTRAPLIAKFSDTIERVEPTLALDGLRLIHARNA